MYSRHDKQLNPLRRYAIQLTQRDYKALTELIDFAVSRYHRGEMKYLKDEGISEHAIRQATKKIKSAIQI